MFKKVLTFVLVIALMIAMVGCGQGKEKEPQDSTPTKNGEDSTKGSEDSTGGSADNQPVSNPYPDPNNPVRFTLFADTTWLPYDNLDGITGKEIERLTGVSFELIKATDSEQLNLLISSGDLPDLVMTGSSSKQNKLSTSDLCYSYNELIEKYAPD